ncbi:CHAT domain-containing protein [Streptomyces sp. TRM70350]|uniref:CHAT domain-containing protein n=1 Tax=Streptomyces sp. TRM70350 TaxID=2856165 RepID=UPI001C45C903|nr:CHAT domain-containing protein [Streptomyces sp. TRM70350]MBV7699551.1 CHAT domain-containing protein [Streptomyces sp. TRM70350]
MREDIGEHIGEHTGDHTGGDIGWARAELLAERLGQRLESFWAQGVREAVMAPEAVAEADELRAYVLRTGGGEGGGPLYVLDRSVVAAIAHLHYARCLVMGPDSAQARPEAQLTLMLFAVVARFTPQEVPDDLRPTVATLAAFEAEDLEESAARALELLGRWQTASDAAALKEAIARWQQLLEVLPASHPGRAMLLSNLCAGLRSQYTLHGVEADVEQSADLGFKAVRRAAPDDPNRGMYYANLSGTLILRYALRRDPADLEAAVDTGRQAVRVAPEPHALFHSNAGLALLERYERHAAAADLDAATEEFRAAVRHARHDDPQRPMYLCNLGRALEKRYVRLRQPADLEAALTAARQAVAECPPAHPGRHGFLLALSQTLRTKAQDTGADADLDAAVDTARQAVAAVPDASPDRGDTIGNLGLALRLRFDRRQRRADIEEAVALLRGGFPDGGGAHHLYNLARVELARFRQTDDRADIDAAITAARRSADAAAGSHEQGVPLSLLGEALLARANRTNSRSDTDEAITVLTRARALLADYHPTALSVCLSELGNAHTRRFDTTADPADLDRAIDAFQEAIRHSPDHPDRVVDESHLGGSLLLRHSRTNSPDDLAEALAWNRRAADRIADVGHEHAGQVLFNLGRTLQAVYQRNDDLSALDEAVRRLEDALRARHRGPADRAKCLSNLGAALRVRAERLGGRADLDRAVDLSRQAVAALPADHPDRAIYLSNLATTLQARYGSYGAQQDLADAVRAGRESVEATAPSDTTVLVVHLTNLGIALRRRYEWSGALDDLDESIEVCRAAVRALPPGHVDESLHRSNLAVALISRYGRTGVPADGDEAVEAARAAADSVPDDHPQRATHLSNLALALRARSDGRNRPADADEAIDHIRHAIRLCPAGHPRRPLLLTNLCTALLAAERDDPATLTEAASAARTALRATPEDHPQRASSLSTLGQALVARARLEGDPDDLATAFDLFRQSTGIATAPAAVRFRAARTWAMAATAAGEWHEALDAYRAAIAELPLLAWHGLDRRDRLDALGRAAGVAGEAAAVALSTGRPHEALRLLEQGRGVLLAQALDARDDMTDLRERAPHLADRIREIRALLDQPSADTTGAPHPARAQRAAAEQRRELAQEMDALVARVRELPGLEDFLRLPSLERLQSAAAHGPVVVVNTSTVRCDALVVTRTDVHTVPLPDLHLTEDDGLIHRTEALLDALSAIGRSPADAWRAQRILTRTLAWLWDTVAAPVLAALPDDTPTSRRLWWCPTGLLTLLPLHAAGHYTGRKGPSLPDHYICSYTTTLRALSAAQTRPTPPATPRMLAVDQSATPGLPPLPHAAAEVRRLSHRIPHTTVLTGPQATREALLQHLPTHPCLHFSGHGTQDPTDSASGALYLHDHEQSGPLTVADISRLRLTDAQLAFLSACETARGAAAVPDEAAHLAGTLQLAGFPHVVAAQWAVDDACALKVADTFYAGLTTPDQAAQALHTAVQRLRRENSDPLWWAAYVHTGP